MGRVSFIGRAAHATLYTYDSERASYRARNGVVVGPLTEDYHVSAAQSLLRLQLHFAFGSPCDFDGSILCLHVSAPPRRGATHPVTTAGRQLPTFKQVHPGVAPPAHPWGENMLPVSMARGGTLLHQTLKQTLELADRSGSFNNALRQMIVHSNQSKGTT